jgi:nucleotide-binding universal stress UspA family protein
LGEELVVGLVVVGNKVKSTIERALMGSDAGSIARYFRYPVLVVRGR